MRFGHWEAWNLPAGQNRAGICVPSLTPSRPSVPVPGGLLAPGPSPGDSRSTPAPRPKTCLSPGAATQGSLCRAPHLPLTPPPPGWRPDTSSSDRLGHQCLSTRHPAAQAATACDSHSHPARLHTAPVFTLRLTVRSRPWTPAPTHKDLYLWSSLSPPRAAGRTQHTTCHRHVCNS